MTEDGLAFFKALLDSDRRAKKFLAEEKQLPQPH